MSQETDPEVLRTLAVDAVDMLNEFIGDFVAATMTYREYHSLARRGRVTMQEMVAIQKMCFSHLVLGLAKFLEFYQHYHSVIPEGIRRDVKNTKKIVEAKGVMRLRNAYAGHIWDDEHQRPLRGTEVEAHFRDLMRNDPNAFLLWINNPDDNAFPNTMVGVVETLRDQIAAEFEIAPEEVTER